MIKQLTIMSLCLLLAACGTTSRSVAPTNQTAAARPASTAPALPKAGSGRGGYYQDDGPGDNPPADLELTLDAEPTVLPYSTSGNKPYVVFGKTYTPMIDDKPFTQRGVGSWYGKKFHGQRTSSGELYDMYKMTAAHPTLPIPSYARITNVTNGRQVIVKINDRGPFLSSRIVDLSYTAALKLGYVGKGSSQLLLERLLPADIEKMAENKKNLVTENVAVVQTEALPVTAPVDIAGFEALVAANSVEPIAELAGESTVKPTVENTPANINGFYLQFGAFGLRSNAEATFNRLQNQLAQLPGFEIVQQGTLYRLLSGPFSNHEEANNALKLALNAGVAKPVIVQR